MSFQIGNNVRVLDEDLQGKIVAIKEDQITIETEDQMHFSFRPHELVVVTQDQKELSKFSDIHHPLLREKLNDKTKRKSLFKKEKSGVVLEIDLHIEKLVSSTRNMDTFDILNYQMRVAKQKLEWALARRISKIIFIHGVGDGVLKQELLLILKRYPVKFYDASFKKYGYGATEVVLFKAAN